MKWNLSLRGIVAGAMLSAALVLAACGGGKSTPIKLAPLSVLPAEVQRAPAPVREAYRFAVANQDYLAQFPCYCGCGAVGHKSNTDCYIQQVNPDGSIVFAVHAFGRGICVDITRDVMRLTKQGKSAVEIRKYVDRTYSKFGPSTDTPPVTP